MHAMHSEPSPLHDILAVFVSGRQNWKPLPYCTWTVVSVSAIAAQHEQVLVLGIGSKVGLN